MPTRTPSPEAGPDGAAFRGPLVVAWLVVSLLSIHKFAHRGITESSPPLDAESLLHVLAFAAAGMVALVTVRAFEPTLDRARPPLVLMLLPAWTMVSGLWSATGAYAIVRGAQLVAVAVLAWATVALGRADPAGVRQLVEAYLRWFVRVTAVLVGLGVAFGPLWVLTSEANLERFTWVGAHPLASGLVLAAAAVIATTVPPAVLGVHPWVRTAMAATFVVALVPNHSRQMWLALAVVLVLALGLAGRLNPMVRWVGGPLAGAAAVAGLAFRGPEIWDYLLRDQDTGDLSTGNGRLGLWSIGSRALETPVDWLIGLGHGITRTVFVADEPWARTAHSSLLAALVSLGLVGLVLLLAVVVATVRDVWAGRLWATSAGGFTLTLLLVLVLLNGLVADNLVVPNLASAVLYLAAAVALVQRARPEVVPPARPEGPAPPAGPAATGRDRARTRPDGARR